VSKTQQKNRSEVEHLRGEVKRLKSLNRQLRKRLSASLKKEHFFEQIEEEADEVELVDACSSCGSGVMVAVDLKFVKYKVCSECKHREKI